MCSIPSHFLPLSQKIIEYATLLWERGFVATNGGNISVKTAEGFILSTPTMVSKGELLPEEMVVVNMLGNKLFGFKEASSELNSHIAIYRANPQANAIIHSHPPYSCSYACSDSLPFMDITPEAVIWVDNLALIPYISPNTEELADAIGNASVESRVLLLKNHGLFTWGENLREAWWRTEAMESLCKVSHLISARGGEALSLSKKEIEEIRKKYKK